MHAAISPDRSTNAANSCAPCEPTVVFQSSLSAEEKRNIRVVNRMLIVLFSLLSFVPCDAHFTAVTFCSGMFHLKLSAGIRLVPYMLVVVFRRY